MPMDIVAVGEPLVQLNAVTRGPLRHVQYFEKHSTGSEANVCVAAARLGMRSGLITRLGNDEFGLFIRDWLRGEGVDVSRVVMDGEHPTGIYFVQRGYPVPGVSDVVYYRHGSAASFLSEEDVDRDYVRESRVLHTTGITLAISESARSAAMLAMDEARRAGALVSLDLNIRRKLWRNMDEAVDVVGKAMAKAGVVFMDEEEASMILGAEGVDAAFREAERRFGLTKVVLKLGRRGSVARWDGEEERVNAFEVPVEDPIGAGDAYVGVFLSSMLKGMGLRKSMVRASAAAAMVVTVRGDEENLPREGDIDVFLRGFGGDVDLR
ncbi:sugar kinase [Thermocladium modestius]|nr:sugar kinase [Thermocladium modestius]